MSSYFLDINHYFSENKLILFSCQKNFTKQQYGIYIIYDDESCYLWNFNNNESSFDFHSKQKLFLGLEKIYWKEFQILEFTYNEGLKKFLMIIRTNEAKIYMLVLDHTKHESEFRVEQKLFLIISFKKIIYRIYLLDHQKKIKDIELNSNCGILKFSNFDDEFSIQVIS